MFILKRVKFGEKMALWLLKAIEQVDYDETRAMVVSADTEHAARQIATEDTENEHGIEGKWMLPQHSTCEQLTEEFPSGVVIADFKAG